MVVQRSTPFPAVLLRLGGSDPDPGPGWRGSPLHHHQSVWGMASWSGHHIMPPVPSRSAQTAPQLCHPGHELHPESASDRPAEERRTGRPCPYPGCGSGGRSVWDGAALFGYSGRQRPRPRRHVGVWSSADGCWGGDESGCGELHHTGVPEEETRAEEEADDEDEQSQETGQSSGQSIQRVWKRDDPEQQGNVYKQNQPDMKGVKTGPQEDESKIH